MQCIRKSIYFLVRNKGIWGGYKKLGIIRSLQFLSISILKLTVPLHFKILSVAVNPVHCQCVTVRTVPSLHCYMSVVEPSDRDRGVAYRVCVCCCR